MNTHIQRDPVKAWTWRTIFIITFSLIALSLSMVSCSDQYEVIEPQQLRYEITGENYYAVAYEKGATGYAYMMEDYLEIKDGYSVTASIGDSLNVMIMSGGTPWEVKHADVKIWLGNELVAEGSTKETGFLSIKGKLGYGLFVERKK